MAEQPGLETKEQSEFRDATVCYCYKQSCGVLKDAYEKYGSLQEVQKHTKAGTGCGGCQHMLQTLFNERTIDINQIDRPTGVGTSCKKPGKRDMFGFVVADGNLESKVYSSNAVAPQLGDCDSSAVATYALLAPSGVPIHQGHTELKTNETFFFDTNSVDIPRPFHGIFLLQYDRQNVGAARFNIHWTNEKSITSTHENATTGRPRAILPMLIDQRFLEGPNTMYVALMNPHQKLVPFSLSVFDAETRKKFTWKSQLGPFQSAWINGNEKFFGPAISRKPDGRYAMKVETHNLDQNSAITVYFFIHNKELDTWTAQHL